jgi:hypothetical protein
MYSTAGHRQEHRTKHNPQQAAKNPPTEAQKKPTLKLPNLKIQSEKNEITSLKVPADGRTG